MFLTGKGEEASRILERAARLRLRFACDEQEIPPGTFKQETRGDLYM